MRNISLGQLLILLLLCFLLFGDFVRLKKNVVKFFLAVVNSLTKSFREKRN